MMLSRASCRARTRIGLGEFHSPSTTTLQSTHFPTNGSHVARRAYLCSYSSNIHILRRFNKAATTATWNRSPANSRNNSSSGPRSNTPAIRREGLVDLEGKPVYPISPQRPNVPAEAVGNGTTPYQSQSNTTPDIPKRDVLLRISKEVATAISNGQPVVALETTIYTHGFPYPQNLELARNLEDIVRQNGATPATIGIVDGVAVVGLDARELKNLCSRIGDPTVMKVSRRDLPYIMGKGLAGHKISGGTTISGTMFIAAEAGIRVFGTGGLGGVHRGGEDTMDVSADLTELGRTSVAVISSGCKSFLDLPRTLEFLETQGATVCTFADGREGHVDFPSFYTRDSGIKSPMVIQNPKEAAAMIYSQRLFGRRRGSGILLANPISEDFSIPKEEINVAIDQAVKEAAEQGFHGHANTPFILSRIKDLTDGRSIPANRALIQRNVKVAAQVAVELARFLQPEASEPIDEPSKGIYAMSMPEVRQTMSSTQNTTSDLTIKLADLTFEKNHPDILVLGSVAVDLSCDYAPKGKGPEDTTVSRKVTFDVVPQMHTSNIATITQSVGGVGHNVALAAHRASSGLSVQLQSVVGDDLAGKYITQSMQDEGMDISRVKVKKAVPGEPNDGMRTAQYVAVNDQKKDLVLAMADMGIFSNTAFKKKFLLEEMPNLKWAVVDANWDGTFARHLMKTFKRDNTKVAFEPVSNAKAAGIFQPARLLHSIRDNKLTVFPDHKVDLITPNKHELAAMYKSARKHEFLQDKGWWKVIDALGIPSTGARTQFVHLTNTKLADAGIPLQTIQLLPFFPTIITKLGSEGVLMTQLLKPGDPRLTNPDSAPWILSRCTNGSTEVGGVYMRLFPAIEQVADKDVVSVNGVGDTFLGVLVAGLARGIPLGESLINVAQKGAVMTLKSKLAVSPLLGELAGELKKLEEMLEA